MAALSIEIMLPAFPEFVRYFSRTNANTAQTVITSYMLGFALGQVFYGSLSDAQGRRPLLMVGFAIYVCPCLPFYCLQQ